VADLATLNGAVHVLCSHMSVGLLALLYGDFSKAVAAFIWHRQICFLYNGADGNGRMALQLQQEHFPDW